MLTTKNKNQFILSVNYNNSYWGLVLISIILFVLTSCKHNGKLGIYGENEITFDTLYTNKAYHINNDSVQPSCNLKLTFIYPIQYKNKPVLDSIQYIFISSFIGETSQYKSPSEALEKYEKDYIEGYKHDMEMFYGYTNTGYNNEEDKYLSYYETIDDKIIFNKADILSFQISRTNYKGGANTYQFYTNYSINLKTGTLITEEEIFKPEYKDILSSLFKEAIMKENNVKDISELNNVGYFGLEEISSNNNFLIEQTGITYTFNTGEYSAYKLDPITITIPYGELHDILKDDSPISFLIDNQ